MDKNVWDDIGYNFLVGGDGSAYVGRGWDLVGAHTKGYNKNSVCIAFIGTFNEYGPTDQQLCAAQQLIVDGVRQMKLIQDYKLYGHRQLTQTDSPGNVLFKIITSWIHWSEEKFDVN